MFLDGGSRYTRIYSSQHVAYVNTKIDKRTTTTTVAAVAEDRERARDERSKIDKGCRGNIGRHAPAKILGASEEANEK